MAVESGLALDPPLLVPPFSGGLELVITLRENERLMPFELGQADHRSTGAELRSFAVGLGRTR